MNKVTLNNIFLNAVALNGSRIGKGKASAGESWKDWTGYGTDIIEVKNAKENSISMLKLYGGNVQNGAPKPTAPAVINTNRGALRCGNLGANMLNINEANIVNGKYLNNSGEETGSAANFYVAQFIPVKAGVTYTSSFSTPIGYFSYMEYDENFVFIKRTLVGGGTSAKISHSTFTMGSTTAYVVVGSNPTSAQNSIEDILAIKWMFNEGENALPYEPYKAGLILDGQDTVSVRSENLNEGSAEAELLLLVGDYADSQDIVKGEVIRKVGIKVLDGAESGWMKGSNKSADGNSVFYIAVNERANNDYSLILMSTHYVFSGTVSYSTLKRGCMSITQTTKNMYFDGGDATELTEWKAYLAQQCAKGTPVIVIYPLAEDVVENVEPVRLANPKGDFDILRSAGVSGLEMEVALKVKDDEAGGLINFTIDGVPYQAEQGMNWEQWCNSEYNADGWYCSGPENQVTLDVVIGETDWDYSEWKVLAVDGTWYTGVNGKDVITDGAVYDSYTDSSGIGGGGY